MKRSRRDFVTTGLSGMAALAGLRGLGLAFEPQGSPADEDGYRLWLRYAPMGAAGTPYRRSIRTLNFDGDSPTLRAARNELDTALGQMFGEAVPASAEAPAAGALVIGTPATSPAIRALGLATELTKAGPEGFVIRTIKQTEGTLTAIAAERDIGVLYGVFHFLRLVQTRQPIEPLNVLERPKLQLRLVNHWDNLNGTIERGYAGRSLWQWSELPETISPRYLDYARANASIGLNGAVVNNVNADARILSREYLRKVAAIADVWRPWGVRMYLSANVASPMKLDGLPTADPLDSAVADWWKRKAVEIYELIPDFGGFTVKANSEGQPGPKDYGRTHAQGANVLAAALEPHSGRVIWRAFIYDEDVDPDRAKRAYIEFTKLDGEFMPNVVVQVKNGAIDFQPREPFHPLFGAMKKTPVIAEIQATQEYLGQAKHLVYLGTMWKEFLDADTHAAGPGSTVGRVLEGQVHPYPITGLVSVVNPGLDRNWCGHHFSQANWYASGRLAWSHELAADRIAHEWIRMTLTNEQPAVDTLRELMMGSHEAFVGYTMPLGLHHLIGGDHYAPMPENDKAPRRDWTATYYHQASSDGIGFNRTMRGNQAVAQYFPPVRDRFDSLATCPETLLLWFHRCRWDHRLRSGRTLWAALCEKYADGAREAARYQDVWRSLSGGIDVQRHKEVAERLAIQAADAATWRDQALKYFQKFSRKEIPGARGSGAGA